VPAAAEWDGPFGIEPAEWEAAHAGGTWGGPDVDRPPGLVHTETNLVDGEAGRVFFFHDWSAVDWEALYSGEPASSNESAPTSWARRLDSDEWTPITSMPGVPGWGMPFGSIAAMAHHPGLDLFVATRAEDGVTFGYDATADEWIELVTAYPGFTGRYGYGLVYDRESGLLVRFGGAEWGRTDQGKHVGLAETWVFDAATMEWTEVSPPESPPARRWPQMVYDTRSDRIVLFGGDTALSGDPLGDTWVFDANTTTWTEMHPAVSPPARAEAATWYDPTADAMFVFGGDADRSAGPALPWMVLGGEELWSYDLERNTWTLHRVDSHPGYRFGLDAGFDTARGEAVILGGDTYDENRRYIGWQQEIWTYQHQDQ
jgi:hypothetical protein